MKPNWATILYQRSLILALARPVERAGMGDGAEMSRPDHGGVFVQRAGPPRGIIAWSPRRPAAGELVVRNAEGDRARRAVDPDRVAVLDQRDRPAGGGLGARVTNADPRVAPENLPSVTSATFSPMPWPYIRKHNTNHPYTTCVKPHNPLCIKRTTYTMSTAEYAVAR